MTALINPTAPVTPPGEHEIAGFGRLHQRLGDAVETAVHGKRAVVDLALVFDGRCMCSADAGGLVVSWNAEVWPFTALAQTSKAS